MGGDGIELRVAFRYRHRFGALAPWAAGLERGEAMATRCAACGRAWFAPRLVCACGGRAMAWAPLPGTGTVRVATEGAMALPLTGREGGWPLALIAMDGACNAVLGRLAEGVEPAPGLRVRLARDPGPHVHPVQSVLFAPLGPT